MSQSHNIYWAYSLAVADSDAATYFEQRFGYRPIEIVRDKAIVKCMLAEGMEDGKRKAESVIGKVL